MIRSTSKINDEKYIKIRFNSDDDLSFEKKH